MVFAAAACVDVGVLAQAVKVRAGMIKYLSMAESNPLNGPRPDKKG